MGVGSERGSTPALLRKVICEGEPQGVFWPPLLVPVADGLERHGARYCDEQPQLAQSLITDWMAGNLQD